MTHTTQNTHRRSWHVTLVTGWRPIAAFAFLVTGLSSQVSALPAFPGAQGFGVETAHGRGGIVIRVTNTNDSGPGSLREALRMTKPRIIVFTVSGTIRLKTPIHLDAAQSYVYVAGQTAPGDGIALAGPNEQSPIRLSPDMLSSDTGNIFHDGVFQHLRFRHGATGPGQSNTDGVQIFAGTYNVVFDHNSLTWAGDEAIGLWVARAEGEPAATHDVTFSHNIIGEGANPEHNLGPLFSGGSTVGDSIYNITMHHNLGIHLWYRVFKLDTGSQSPDRGVQYINNIHYNSSIQDYGFGQNQYSGCSATVVDIIGDYFKAGPAHPAGRSPVTIQRDPIRSPPPGCLVYHPVSLHFENSTWRRMNGTPHSDNNETNNYEMVTNQYGAETWRVRSTPLVNQPKYPVSITSAARAYADVVINENVGATKPRFDAVDRRLVDDPEDGGGFSFANIPPPNGTYVYPTLRTYNVPMDADLDGVPDYFEIIIGTDPNVAQSQAVEDHDGDGYTNIEEYIHSLSDPVAQGPPESRPKPPFLSTVN